MGFCLFVSNKILCILKRLSTLVSVFLFLFFYCEVKVPIHLNPLNTWVSLSTSLSLRHGCVSALWESTNCLLHSCGMPALYTCLFYEPGCVMHSINLYPYYKWFHPFLFFFPYIIMPCVHGKFPMGDRSRMPQTVVQLNQRHQCRKCPVLKSKIAATAPSWREFVKHLFVTRLCNLIHVIIYFTRQQMSIRCANLFLKLWERENARGPLWVPHKMLQ